MVLSCTAMWVTVLLLPSNCSGKAGFWTEKQSFLWALGEDPTLLCSGKTILGKGVGTDLKRENRPERSARQSTSKIHIQANREVTWSHYSHGDVDSRSLGPGLILAPGITPCPPQHWHFPSICLTLSVFDIQTQVRALPPSLPLSDNQNQGKSKTQTQKLAYCVCFSSLAEVAAFLGHCSNLEQQNQQWIPLLLKSFLAGKAEQQQRAWRAVRGHPRRSAGHPRRCCHIGRGASHRTPCSPSFLKSGRLHSSSSSLVKLGESLLAVLVLRGCTIPVEESCPEAAGKSVRGKGSQTHPRTLAVGWGHWTPAEVSDQRWRGPAAGIHSLDHSDLIDLGK